MTSIPSIRKLDETVINRIAAGEVIQRPANALKELIENSLDAKSTKIQIFTKQGGLKFLQIQDNGIGIRKEDLGIVCERFTTSKLTKFEDLTRISTYGFRGEALASISHVAHLTIVTKVADSQVGYEAKYEDSKLKEPPKARAATQGTQITVTDLFYNIVTRKKALKNPSEEHAKIVDVVSKYAIHNSKVGFSLKRKGEGGADMSDVKTNENSTVVDNIRTIYGNTVAKELLEIKSADEMLQFQLYGQITNVNYSNKKLIFLLFINNRLVDSSGLRKVIESIYSTYLPKNSHPFIYLSINLDPHNVDVNVHPTKYEVHFLHEEAIVEKVKTVIETKLVGSNTSRVFFTQAKLPTTFTKDLENKEESSDKKLYAHKTVRTDSAEQKLDKFFKEPIKKGSESIKKADETENSPAETSLLVKEKREFSYKSLMQLRTDVQNNLHNGLCEIVKNFTFVGHIDPGQCLLQNDTKLYLCNSEKLFEELFYQILLFEFGNFGVIRFSSPISIKELAMCYLDSEESEWIETDGPKDDLAKQMTDHFIEKKEMLDDYFSIEVDLDGNLCTLPLIIDKYMPNIAILPSFVVRLCAEVDWNLEKPCFDGVCREIARFYAKLARFDDDESGTAVDTNWKWTSEHVLLAAVKSTLMPPAKFAQDGTILQIANLPDLYKVFERC